MDALLGLIILLVGGIAALTKPMALGVALLVGGIIGLIWMAKGKHK